jgi:hypothetical protein
MLLFSSSFGAVMGFNMGLVSNFKDIKSVISLGVIYLFSPFLSK